MWQGIEHKRVLTKMRVIRGCLGPWNSKPRWKIRVKKGPDGRMQVERRDIPAMRQELKDIIEEQG